MTAANPALLRHRLRTELKRARTEAGPTQLQVAEALDWSVSKVIRIESGETGVSSTDLKALLEQYGATDRYDNLVALAKSSRRKPWAEYLDLISKTSANFFGLEAAARVIRSFQNTIIPGLLQTKDYTRSLLTGAYGLSDEATERHIEVRRARQTLLDPSSRDEREAFFIMDEAVLKRVVGDAALMRSQLERLKELAELPHVTIQVLSFATGTNFGMKGPFVYLEFEDPDDADVLYLENTSGEEVFRDNSEVTEPYRLGFQHLEKLAVPPQEFGHYVDHTIRDLGR